MRDPVDALASGSKAPSMFYRHSSFSTNGGGTEMSINENDQKQIDSIKKEISDKVFEILMRKNGRVLSTRREFMEDLEERLGDSLGAPGDLLASGRRKHDKSKRSRLTSVAEDVFAENEQNMAAGSTLRPTSNDIQVREQNFVGGPSAKKAD